MLQKSGYTNKGILCDFKNQMTQDYVRYNDWRISKFNNSLILEKAFYKSIIYKDDVWFIEKFLDKLYNREYNSILCGGLGLGVAPYLSQTFCDIIDVVEVDNDLIHLINTAGYLNPNVNIIHGDFFSYEPQRKYDVILVDIWLDNSGGFSEESDTMIEKYTPYINDGGLLYLPLLDFLGKPCNC